MSGERSGGGRQTYGESEPAVFEGRVGLEDEYGGPAAGEVREGPAGGADLADDGQGEERPDAEGFRGGERLCAWLPDGRYDALLVYGEADSHLLDPSLRGQCLDGRTP